MACCPPGSLPALAFNHVDKGTEIVVPGSDLKLYVVGSGEVVILHFYDILGFKGGRTRFNCDRLSEQGYKVVIPDLFRGESALGKPMNKESLMPWVKKFLADKCVEDVETVIKYLQSEGATKFGATSTCWGSWIVAHCCAKGLPIEAAVNFHPSLTLEEDLFEGNLLELINKVKAPQLWLPAGNDPDNVKPGGEVIKTLEKNGVVVESKEYPKQVHGYMSRSDLSHPENAKDFEDATETAYLFLAKFLKQ